MSPSLYPSFVTHAVSGVQASLIYRAVSRQLDTMPTGPTHRQLELLLAQLGDDIRQATHREVNAMRSERMIAAQRADDLIERARGTVAGEAFADFLDERRAA